NDQKLSPEPLMIPIGLNNLDEVQAASASLAPATNDDAVSNKLLEWIMGKATNLKKAVGEYHPAYSEALKMLISSYASWDNTEMEEELTLEYMNVINHKTLQDFSFLSESEKELYYQTRLPDINSFTAYSLTRKKANPAITCHTYNNILLNKGLMLKSSTAMRVAILSSNDPELLRTYDEWIALQKEISAMYSTPVELRTKDLQSMEQKAVDLEKTLVSKSQDFSDYRKKSLLTWEDVKKSLKPDEAAIEFTDFKKKEKDGGDADIYAALIVRSDSRYPEMVRLFEEDELVELLGNLSSASSEDIKRLYGGNDYRLYNMIWKPVEGYLQGIRNVYISPTGLLYRISIPALSNGADSHLCDRYNVLCEGSTGNISGNHSGITGNQSALIFGGIKYNRNESTAPVWDYLAGTKSEADAISNILSKGSFKVEYLSEANATETFFKTNAGNYDFLHLATHGFFFDDPNKVRFEEKKEEVEYGEVTFRGAPRGGFGVSNFVNNSNPLMRSGLVMAGANEVWVKKEQDNTDDGVLTAQEVTQIDMRKNSLVVLSACETGLGDIRGSEGVYGLQRALKMAGVKNIIMSLWQIPDKETVEFMESFYRKLLSDRDIRQAFSETQREMRQKYNPYYWGAFVLME
ncbi:MAG TPA: CHAT domain-containing protein, partial [Bacteroidales bacterium]|nr:CHAT domain-containing protein [Bacteroidales bacterium]